MSITRSGPNPRFDPTRSRLSGIALALTVRHGSLAPRLKDRCILISWEP